MSELKERFESLGLSQYFDAFITEGFDSWEIVADVSEADLTTLNVKLGHRRKLQRAITEWRNESGTAPLLNTRRRASVDGSYRSDESGNESKSNRGRDPATAAPPQSTKRKYRRHPKPDEHAPERPPSAYVIFSNQVRETLKGQDLSFADIAKIVGERWQVLSPSSREACDKQATTAKEKYYQDLAEYKKTPHWAQYQVYLADFKAKYNSAASGREEGKRSKLGTETSVSSAQSSTGGLDKTDRTASRRSDAAALYPSHGRAASGEYVDQPTQGTRYPPISDLSPINRPFTSVNSPHATEQYSSMSTSPASASANREPSFLPATPGHDLRSGLGRGRPAYLPPSASPPPYPPYDPTYDFRHRRRDAPELTRADSSVPSVPSLAHTETSLSSLSQVSRQGSSSGLPMSTTLPPLDAPKALRTLPQPIPTLGIAPSPLDAPTPAGLPTRLASPPTVGGERSTGLSALLMATEMVDKPNPAPGPRPPS